MSKEIERICQERGLSENITNGILLFEETQRKNGESEADILESCKRTAQAWTEHTRFKLHGAVRKAG